MEPEIRQAYEATRPMADKPFASACYSPFTSLFFNTNGDVTPCCKNAHYVLGNVQKESLTQIWRGARAQALRRNLRNYNFQLNCDYCRWQIEGGQYDQVYATTFDRLPVAGEAPEWPSMLEFTLSNTCNLACVMCYGVLSSTIRAQREKLPPLPRVYGDAFFADLRPFLHHLHKAKFFGGEPFLSQENLRVFEMMIEDGLTVPCHVTTNGTQWNARVERILEALPVGISVSVDGTTRETVESIRINARFDEVMANVRRFREYSQRKHTYMSLTYCLMRQNWHEFGDYLRLGDDLGLDVYINTVVHPTHCSLYTLPPDELQRVCDRMQALDDEQHYGQLRRNGPRWHSGLAALRKNANERQNAGLGEVRRNAARLRAVVRGDHLSRARFLEEDGKLDAALLEYRRVPQDSGDAFAAALGEAVLCRRLGQLADAEAAARRATALRPHAAQPWDELAEVLRGKGDLPGAIAAAQRALELADDADTRWTARANLATLRFENGDAAGATAVLDAMPADDPHTADALALRARALRLQGRLDAAAAALGKALQLARATPQPWLERAWLCAAQGQPAEGLECAEAANARLPEGSPLAADVHHVMATLLATLGRLQEAVAHADALVELRPQQQELVQQRDALRAQLPA